MDVVINSLVQSPLIRTMETVASKANSFTHHIPDNCPPHSEAKITVQSRDADPTVSQLNSSISQTFDVPAYGYLRRAVVKVTFQVAENSGNAYLYNKFGLYALIDRIELKSRNRPIQRVYGRNQYCKDLWKGGSEFERKLHMARFKDVNTFKILEVISHKGPIIGPPAGTPTMGDTGHVLPAQLAADVRLQHSSIQYVVAYFEIDLASTVDLAHNYNTRFVEPLQIQVVFRPVTSIVRSLPLVGHSTSTGNSVVPLTCPPDNWDYWSQSRSNNEAMIFATSGTVQLLTTGLVNNFKAVLLCYYINFHDVTEVDIRNANFKPEVPALLFQYDTVEEPSQALDLDTSFSQPEGPTNMAGYINTAYNSAQYNYTGIQALPKLNSHAQQNSTAGPVVGLPYTGGADPLIGGARTAVSQLQASGALTPVDNLESPGVQVGTKEVKITSNNLAYSIAVLCDIDEFPLHFMPTITSVVLTGSGQTLYSATGYENSLVDRLEEPLQTLQGKPDQGCGAALFQYSTDQLVYGSNYSPFLSNPMGHTLRLYKTVGSIPATGTLATSTGTIAGLMYQTELMQLAKAINKKTQRSLQNPALIRFSLGSDQTYNSGAVGLQTISNPKVTVKVISNEFATTVCGLSLTTENTDTDGTKANSASFSIITKAISAFRIYTYVNHHAIVQIDSGTGAVTRSIDS